MIYEDRITDLLNAAQAGKLSADRALREASDKKVTQLFTDIRDDLVNKRESIDTINVSLEKDRAREEGLASEIKQLAEEKEELERSLGALERAADNAGAQIEALQTRLSSSPGDEEKSELEKSLQKAEAALAEAVAGQEPRRERLRAIPKDAEAAIAQRSTLTERLREKAENRSANIWSFLELADEFAADLSVRIMSGLDRIIPDDGVDREYLIESDTENLLGKEELINRLKQPDTGLRWRPTSRTCSAPTSTRTTSGATRSCHGWSTTSSRCSAAWPATSASPSARTTPSPTSPASTAWRVASSTSCSPSSATSAATA